MPDWKILLTKTTQKELSAFSKQDYKKIIKRIENLYNSPYLGKKLKGELSEFYSYCAWPYRIIYQINKELHQIIILAVSHRQSSY
jgi:mRNA-degrading endonuclease RelE of RelBE toxin-antitoxin system